jgi:putative hemolysin
LAKVKEFVNVRKLFKEKNPRLAKWMPGFVFSWVERLIHQKELNEALANTDHLKGVAFANHILNKLETKISIIGLANIPTNGSVVIAANHPLGGLDGMALISAAAQARPDVKFIVNDILMKLPNFEDIFVGVNKVGTTTREALQLVDKTFAGSHATLMFPAGLCSRKIDGIIQDIEWQKSFVAKAVKYNSPIVPTFISGTNSKRFYNLSNWRKKLGIKSNIEMMTLPDELFKQKGKALTIIFGQPIAPTVFNKTKKDQDWAAALRALVYKLPNDCNATLY